MQPSPGRWDISPSRHLSVGSLLHREVEMTCEFFASVHEAAVHLKTYAHPDATDRTLAASRFLEQQAASGDPEASKLILQALQSFGDRPLRRLLVEEMAGRVGHGGEVPYLLGRAGLVAAQLDLGDSEWVAHLLGETGQAGAIPYLSELAVNGEEETSCVALSSLRRLVNTGAVDSYALYPTLRTVLTQREAVKVREAAAGVALELDLELAQELLELALSAEFSGKEEAGFRERIQDLHGVLEDFSAGRWRRVR